MSNLEQTLLKLNDINDDYNRELLVEDKELDIDTKLRALYEYGKQFGYGQSSAWTEAMEVTLDILGIKVNGVN